MPPRSPKVLQDHQQIGKKFIPPMAQLRGLQDVSYILQLLPEIIWMGFINKAVGYQRGVALSLKLATTAKQVRKSRKQVNFALLSSYLKLNLSQRRTIVKQLESEGLLNELKEYLYPLTHFYKGFPLRFLGRPLQKPSRDKLIEQVKQMIQMHIDKHSVPALVLQANVIYIRARTGGLRMTRNIQPPDLDAIISRPDSEEGKRAAAFVRSAVLMEPLLKRTHGWAKSFWDQGFRISACSLQEDNL